MTKLINKIVKVSLAVAVSLVLAAGLLMATFVFICYMKLSDGPGGDNLEALPMIALSMGSLYYPALLFYFAMTNDFERPEYGIRIGRYAALAATAALLGLASFAGFSMNVVQWGADFIHLHAVSKYIAEAACLLLFLSVAEFVITMRRFAGSDRN